MSNRLSRYFQALAAVLLLLLIMSGCAHKRTPASSPHVKSGRHHTADPKAQQGFYDQGLKLYSKENFAEAREAFLQAVEINPTNKLGLKAQENIRKIDQILKTLKEMEKK